tara:strand:+ start:2286 stop:2720 length:435 start_codon:yes stop_codon:yes gene_type:complete
LWSDHALTQTPCALAPAELCTSLTDTFSNGRSGDTISAIACDTRRPALAHTTIVDCAVTVVIFAVADLFGWEDLPFTGFGPLPPFLTALNPNSTETFVLGGRRTKVTFLCDTTRRPAFALFAIIYFSVTVVIFAITDFGLGGDL